MRALRGVLLHLCAFSLAASAATAQVSVYGTIAATNYGYAFNNQSLTYSSDHIGFALGGFYRFPVPSRLTAGVDARFSATPGQTGGNKGFISARFGFTPRHNPLKPYLQIGGGYVHAKVPRLSSIVGSQTITAAALDLAFGLDARLNSFLDWRVFELEGGAGVKNSTSSGSASLSTGLIYHFHPARSRTP